MLLKKPVVHGSIFRFDGQATVLDPRDDASPCYRCLFPAPPPPELAPNCAEAGVLGVLPGLIGMIQATEAIKLLLGIGEPLIGRLLAYDSLEQSFREYKVRKDPANEITWENRDQIQVVELDVPVGVVEKVDVALYDTFAQGQVGSSKLEELIGSVERGLLVTEFWYTRILDPKTQVVTGLTRNGVWDLEMTLGSTVVRILQGKAVVSLEVTRP